MRVDMLRNLCYDRGSGEWRPRCSNVDRTVVNPIQGTVYFDRSPSWAVFWRCGIYAALASVVKVLGLGPHRQKIIHEGFFYLHRSCHHSGAGSTYRLSGTWPRFLAAVLDR